MKFKLRDKVKLPEEVHKNMNGNIIAIFIGDTGIQYKVRYYWQSDAKEIYFYENELIKIEEEK